MKALRYRNSFSTTLTSRPGQHKLPVLPDDKWLIATFNDFTEELAGVLCAISDVDFYQDEYANQTSVEGLILGAMISPDRFNVVLLNGYPIPLPGEKYQHPKYTDQPKASVSNLFKGG